MNSHLYKGEVRHRRFLPKSHAFHYRLSMLYLDLDEIDQIFRKRWFWSSSGPNLGWFRRKDYLGGGEMPLREKVREVVTMAGAKDPAGPIRMLTHVRYFGYCFNPVTFYYCFDDQGERIETIVAEITNTPWNERKAYVLSSMAEESEGPIHRYCFPKSFHVSPFFPMDLDYDWRFSDPGKRLNVHMRLDRNGQKVFDASLNLERHALDGPNLARALLSFPPTTLKVIAGIYFEALRLKIKGVEVYDHPDTVPNEQGEPRT